MPFSIKIFSLVTVMLLFSGIAVAQIPVEVFGGDKKATLGIMFFKYFKTKEAKNSKFNFSIEIEQVLIIK